MIDEKLVYAYDSYPVMPEIAEKIATIRKMFSDLETAIKSEVQGQRYLSIAKTHLETACMFAIKSLTHPN